MALAPARAGTHQRVLPATRRKAIKSEAWGLGLASPWIIGFLLFTLGPFLASLYFGFTNYDAIRPPVWIGLGNYQRMLFEDKHFWLSFNNTLYYTVLSVPLRLVLALFIAVLLNQGLPGQNLLRTAYYMPSVVSGVAASMLWLWLFDPTIGLINTFLSWFGIGGPAWLMDPHWSKPALVLMSMWGIGPQMVIFLAGLQGVPQELYEAAEVDGSGWLRRIRHITIPLITPSIFFNSVMGVIGSFQVFTAAYVMTAGGPANSTLFYVLYLFWNAFSYFRMGYASALAWVLFFVISVLTVIQFRMAGRWVYYEAGPAAGRQVAV